MPIFWYSTIDKRNDIMQKIQIEGGNILSGNIEISGAKNSAVALIPAAILCDEETTIYNVPAISDRDSLVKIIELLKENLKKDRSKTQIVGFSKLNFLEMTRKHICSND